ncbi:Ribose-phosphate pyrophosphokinase [Aduncisulcus paluster]|uniref:Ribose-phosphate pyrophosphokinase 2 n=1 Tax=Aduncisulcus paluster TaxID=2918883 RepID=A0ABQ5KDU9_9EUKA|nr:Ribose-phosphate pyrophosphokinase [Aduncisulcus paluster]
MGESLQKLKNHHQALFRDKVQSFASSLLLMEGSYTLELCTGNSNRPLAASIASKLGKDLLPLQVGSFSDGEIAVQFSRHIRGCDLFIIQPTCPPDVNKNLMELLVIIDAAKRASAKRITAVIPYFGYARQDRKASPRTPITAKLVADLITTAGADRALMIDLHAAQIQGFFSIPVDHIFGSHIFVPYLLKEYSDLDKVTVVSPDAGGANRARKLASRLDAELCLIDKRREAANQCEVMNVIGDVAGAHCIIFDDIIDTAGTVCKAASALMKSGATSVIACITHPVLSGPAHARIAASDLEYLLVSDSIPLTQPNPKIRILSIAGMVSEAIECIHDEQSIGQKYAAKRHLHKKIAEEIASGKITKETASARLKLENPLEEELEEKDDAIERMIISEGGDIDLVGSFETGEESDDFTL